MTFPKYAWKQVKFADLLKKICVQLTGYEDQWGQEGKKHLLEDLGLTVGQVQQLVGEGMRELIHRDIWILRALSSGDKDEDVIITDVRYKNEADIIRQKGGILLRVNASYPGYQEFVKSSKRDVNHVSETDLDDYEHFSAIIENGSSVSALSNQIRTICKEFNLIN